MSEELDCRVCEHYELVYEEYPSEENPIMVFSFHKCNAFDRIYFSILELKEAYTNCPKKSIRIGYGIPGEIIKEINLINLSFRQISGEKKNLIKITPEQSSVVAAPCYSVVDFERKVGVLVTLLDMDIKMLRKVVSTYEENWKGITLLERLFIERGKYSNDTKTAITTLRDIVALRNKIVPYHRPSKEAIEILKNLGINLAASSPTEWQNNADILLRKFLWALQKIREELSSLALEV